VKDCELDYFGLSDVDRETLMAITALDIGTTDLLAALDEGVLTLTLNRPEARNAMSRAINHALARQLAVAALEPNVRCIVLTGAGKGFCAGGDVKGMAASGEGTVGAATIDEAIHRQRVNQPETAGALFKMPKPTLAALPGPAAGAGLSLALACDLRIMASTAIRDDRLRPPRFCRRLWRRPCHTN
jgi:2-(1,2-epoxy-1,2-dihydrophenyl)acetyl-CoA isomerase